MSVKKSIPNKILKNPKNIPKVTERLQNLSPVKKAELGLDPEEDIEVSAFDPEPNVELSSEDVLNIIEDFGDKISDGMSALEPEGVDAIIEDEYRTKLLNIKLESKAKRDQRIKEAEARRQKLNNPTVKRNELEKSADVLLSALPPYTIKGVTAYAAARKIPVWKVICGCVNYVHHSVSMSNIMIEPSWSKENPTLEDTTVCVYCLETFKPKVSGQKFCTDECGRKDAKEKAEISRLDEQLLEQERRENRAKLYTRRIVNTDSQEQLTL